MMMVVKKMMMMVKMLMMMMIKNPLKHTGPSTAGGHHWVHLSPLAIAQGS